MAYRRRRRYSRRRRGTAYRYSPETKLIYANLPPTFSSVGQPFISLDLGLGFVQGAASNQRVGNEFFIKEFRAEFTIAGGISDTLGTGDLYNHLRVMVATWVGESVGPTRAKSWDHLAPSNCKELIGARDLLTVYYDRLFLSEFRAVGSTLYADKRQVKIHLRFPGKGIRIKYSLAGSAYYPNKRLFLSMCSDSTVVPNPGVVEGWYLTKIKDP